MARGNGRSSSVPTAMHIAKSPQQRSYDALRSQLRSLRVALTMAQMAPALRTPCNIWSLVVGPEATHWSSLLVRDHLDGAARLALAHTCPASRDLVLSTAEHATIKVPDVEPAHTARLQAVLRAARRALLARGKLPTTLELQPTDAWQLSYTLGALGEATTWLEELRVMCVYRTLLPSPLMATVGHCCPNLRSLGIVGVPEMPSPEHFPKLTHLCINTGRRGGAVSGAELVYSSTAPYISQLSTLWFAAPSATPFPFPLLLSPGRVGTHLRTLKFHHTLDTTLLGLILQCAPALEQLEVHDMKVESDVHAHAQHRWRQLQLHHLQLSSLARLPVNPVMELVCIDTAPIVACDTISIGEAAAARLKDVRFRWRPSWPERENQTGVYLRNDFPGGADQPAAMRLAFNVLRSWADDDNMRQKITLAGWTMSREVMMELHVGLPAWHRLRFCNTVRWLPDPHLYATLLRLLPDSYRRVDISLRAPMGGGLTPEQVESICMGAPVSRTAPLHITLRSGSDALVAAIQSKMQLCPFPNVTVAV